MTSPRTCWPVEDWPEADQKAWGYAITPAALFEDGGTASHWKPNTQRTVAKAYGRWLCFLKGQGWLGTDSRPENRITKDRVKVYWECLSTQVAPVTAAGRITDLGEAARVMAPETDWNWLKTVARKLVSRARPSRDKGMTTLPVKHLFELGIELMKRAETYPGKQGVRCAARYRTGLMITLLCASGLRRANFTELELSHSFVKQGDRYRIELSDAETKGKRAHGLRLPVQLSPLIDRYLDHWRPILLGDSNSCRLWVTWLGDDLTEAGFYGELSKITLKELGIRLSPHMFRDAIATSVALDDPEHIRMLKPILQHRSLQTTNKHYNLAKQSEAVAKHQQSVLKLRHENRSHQTRRRA
ncbi:MAG: site-specific integrase [Gammaproteobacteria bacterium]